MTRVRLCISKPSGEGDAQHSRHECWHAKQLFSAACIQRPSPRVLDVKDPALRRTLWLRTLWLRIFCADAHILHICACICVAMTSGPVLQ